MDGPTLRTLASTLPTASCCARCAAGARCGHGPGGQHGGGGRQPAPRQPRHLRALQGRQVGGLPGADALVLWRVARRGWLWETGSFFSTCSLSHHPHTAPPSPRNACSHMHTAHPAHTRHWCLDCALRSHPSPLQRADGGILHPLQGRADRVHAAAPGVGGSQRARAGGACRHAHSRGRVGACGMGQGLLLRHEPGDR
jgi:hypothetical protein